MAKGKLNQSREGMRELLIHHLRYEIDMLRCTFGRLRNPLLHECDKNAFIESFCIHARNLIDFFRGNGKNCARAADFTVNRIYEVRSLTKTGLPDDLYGKLNEQIAHLAYQRTKDPTRQIGAQELQQLSDLIEDEAANFRCHLDESFKPYWNDDGRPKFERGTMLRQNLSTTAVSTAVFDMSRSRGQTPE